MLEEELWVSGEWSRGNSRAEAKCLGGQRSLAVALAVGAVKARTHSGKQGFLFGCFKGRMFMGHAGKRRNSIVLSV